MDYSNELYLSNLYTPISNDKLRSFNFKNNYINNAMNKTTFYELSVLLLSNAEFKSEDDYYIMTKGMYKGNISYLVYDKIDSKVSFYTPKDYWLSYSLKEELNSFLE